MSRKHIKESGKPGELDYMNFIYKDIPSDAISILGPIMIKMSTQGSTIRVSDEQIFEPAVPTK